MSTQKVSLPKAWSYHSLVPSFKWSQHLVPGPYETSLAHSDDSLCVELHLQEKRNAQEWNQLFLSITSIFLTIDQVNISVSIYIHGTQGFSPETSEITSTSCKPLPLLCWLPGDSSLRDFKYTASAWPGTNAASSSYYWRHLLQCSGFILPFKNLLWNYLNLLKLKSYISRQMSPGPWLRKAGTELLLPVAELQHAPQIQQVLKCFLNTRIWV